MIADEEVSQKVADTFMNLAKDKGAEAAAHYLASSRVWIAQGAMMIVLAKLAANQEIER